MWIKAVSMDNAFWGFAECVEAVFMQLSPTYAYYIMHCKLIQNFQKHHWISVFRIGISIPENPPKDILDISDAFVNKKEL